MSESKWWWLTLPCHYQNCLVCSRKEEHLENRDSPSIMNYTHSIIYFNKYIDMGKLCDIIHMMKSDITECGRVEELTTCNEP